MTNRERINKMSNEEFINNVIITTNCEMCDYGCGTKECDERSCTEGIKLWLEKEVEMTADDMFKKLGYDRTFYNSSGVKYQQNEKDRIQLIIISNDNGEWSYARYCNYHTEENKWEYGQYEFITEEENKAIQKKIEELKNDKQ